MDAVHNGREGMEPWEAAGDTVFSVKKRENRKYGWVMKTEDPPPSDVLLPKVLPLTAFRVSQINFYLF